MIVVLAACLDFDGGGPPSWTQDPRWLDGTWTDGEGHTIEAWTKEIDLGGGTVGYEGYYRATGLWDGTGEGRWNYGAWSPEVELNLVDGRTAHYAAVRPVGPGRLRVRVSDDPAVPLRPGFLDGDGAVVLKRQGG